MGVCNTSSPPWVQQLRELLINNPNGSAPTIVQTNAFTDIRFRIFNVAPLQSDPVQRMEQPEWKSTPGSIASASSRNADSAQGCDVAYANPKQLGRILKRQEARRKLDEKLGPLIRRPYQHKSRHIHASFRVRNANGSFRGRSTEEMDANKPVETDRTEAGNARVTGKLLNVGTFMPTNTQTRPNRGNPGR